MPESFTFCPLCERKISFAMAHGAKLGGPRCPNCGGPTEGRTGLGDASCLPEVPPRVVVTESEGLWAVSVYPPPISAFDDRMMILLGVSIILLSLWGNAQSPILADFIGPKLLQLLTVALTGIMTVFMINFVFRNWGRFTMSGSGTTVNLFDGLWTWGTRERFELEAIHQIRVQGSFFESRLGWTLVKSLVVDAGREVRFGKAFSDDQRRYLACLLIQKSRQVRRADGHEPQFDSEMSQLPVAPALRAAPVCRMDDYLATLPDCFEFCPLCEQRLNSRPAGWSKLSGPPCPNCGVPMDAESAGTVTSHGLEAPPLVDVTDSG